MVLMYHSSIRLYLCYVLNEKNRSQRMVRKDKADIKLALQHLDMKLSTLYVIETDNLKLSIS